MGQSKDVNPQELDDQDAAVEAGEDSGDPSATLLDTGRIRGRLQPVLMAAVESARRAAAEQGLDAQMFDTLLDPILTAVGQVSSGGLDALQKTIASQEAQLERLRAIISGLQTSIARQVAAQARRERYTSRRWQALRQELKTAFEEDPQAALDRWLQLYSEALLDWQLEFCGRLANEPFAFPDHQPPYEGFFRRATQSLASGDYGASLGFVTYLAEANEIRPSLAIEPSGRALLMIFAGRIYQEKLSNNDAARLYFEKARKLIPKDRRPYAALGSLMRSLEDRNEATNYFKRSVERSPDQPEGYVGMGLLFEDRKLWTKADEWYNQALDALEDETDPQSELVKLLAPGSGNLYYLMARRLQNEKDFVQALQVVDRALDMGMHSEEKYPERRAYRLKGELLEQLKQPVEAGAAFHEAGKLHYWSQETDLAREAFQKVHDVLDKEHQANYWYLADALLLTSYQPKKPDEIFRWLQDSLKAWKEGLEKQPPEELGWPLITRARISERFTDIAENRVDPYWEAVVYLERAVALRDSWSSWWSDLALVYRNLSMEATALRATDKALEIDPEDVDSLEEKAASLANWGRYKESLELIDRRLAKGPSSWAHGITSFLLIFEKQYKSAVEQVKQALEGEPENVWYLSMLGSCQFWLGENKEARKTFEQVLGYYRPDYHEFSLDTFSRSALFLEKLIPGQGYLEQARQIAELALDDETQVKSDSLEILGIVALLKGDLIEGKKILKDAVAAAKAKPAIDSLLDWSLEILADMTKGSPHQAEIEEIDREIRSLASERLKSLQMPTASQELGEKLASLLDEGSTSGATWVGVNAALARLQQEDGDWSNLLVTLRRLLDQRDSFPQVERRLEMALDDLRAAGKRNLENGWPQEALNLYQFGVAFGELSQTAQVQAEFLSRSGFAGFVLNSPDTAQANWRESIERYQAAGEDKPEEAAAQACLDLIASVGQYWSLDAFLEEQPKNSTGEVEPGSEFQQFRKTLNAYLETSLQLSGKGRDLEMLPTVYPVAIEMDYRLLPSDTGPDWILFKKTLPEMRARLIEQMGVSVPGVRVRGNFEGSLPENNYLIMQDEVPIVMGSLPPGMAYCTEAREQILTLGIPEAGLQPAAHPVNGAPGCWVKSEYVPKLREKGIEVWEDPLLFMVYHLQAVLQRNLADFLDLQEVSTLLDTWRKEPGAAQMLDWFVADQGSQARFGRLLRALLDENVPIKDWRSILEAVGEIGLPDEDVHALVQAARLKLKPYLPGNQPGAQRIALPQEVEDKISARLVRQGGKLFFSLLADEAQDLLAEIHNVIDSAQGDQVLVCRDGEARPFVRRLVELELPGLFVIAEAELLAEAGDKHITAEPEFDFSQPR